LPVAEVLFKRKILQRTSNIGSLAFAANLQKSAKMTK
jgi:hypothetical protein